MTLIDAGARWLGIHIAATPLSVIFTFVPFQPLVSLIFIDLGGDLSAVRAVDGCPTDVGEVIRSG